VVARLFAFMAGSTLVLYWISAVIRINMEHQLSETMLTQGIMAGGCALTSIAWSLAWRNRRDGGKHDN